MIFVILLQILDIAFAIALAINTIFHTYLLRKFELKKTKGVALAIMICFLLFTIFQILSLFPFFIIVGVFVCSGLMIAMFVLSIVGVVMEKQKRISVLSRFRNDSVSLRVYLNYTSFMLIITTISVISVIVMASSIASNDSINI